MRPSETVASLGPGLLILDNFEQLVELGPNTVGTWLDQNEALRILVTSRERLRLRGEQVIEVPPMHTSPQDDRMSEAEELFLTRAKAQRADIGSSEDDRARIRAIVQRLEGIPLALELAAARVDVLGLEGLNTRLEAQLPLLAQGPLDAPPRHATLEGAIAWSWQMLSEPERARIAACAIFRGGFTLEAAQAVLPEDSETDRAVELLEQLRRKSLLTMSEPGPKGEVRLDLFEAIRQFMQARLSERGELQTISQRHTRYFARQGETKATEDTADARRWLRLESKNLLAVFERELEQPQGRPEALSALLALQPIYAAQGPYEVYLQLLERALVHADQLPTPLYTQLLRARGKTLQLLGHHERAERDLESAQQRAAQDELPKEQAQLLIDLGVLHHQRRALDEAERCYQRALELQRTRGDQQAEGRVLGNIGALHHDRQDFEPAREYYQRALTLFRSTGERRLEGLYLANLGILEHEREDMSEAEHNYQRALEILDEVEDQRLVAITLGNRGLLQQEMGALQKALESHLSARPNLKHAGEHRSLGLNLMRLGMVRAQLGQLNQAERDLREARSLMSSPQDPLGLSLIDLAGGFLKVTEVHQAWLQTESERAMELVLQIEAKLERAQSQLLDRSDDARLITRMLKRLLPAVQGQPAEALPENALILGSGARWFRDTEGHWRDFRRRRPLRRLLLALIERRLVAPGDGLAMEQLLQAAWPDETIQPASAANRLYVALATLRKQGLKRLLLTEEEGYLLDPKCELYWTSTGAKGLQFKA